MYQKGYTSIIFIVLIIVVLVSVLGYIMSIKKLISIPSTTKTNIELAQEVLVDYFNFLNKKQYGEAIKYHGSGYESLQNWNPTVNINDHISLIKNGCEMNGLKCLKIKNILSRQQISLTEFKFVVQFENSDGTIFKRGPCCEKTEKQMPTKTDFEYIVKKVDNSLLIMTGPVYIP